MKLQWKKARRNRCGSRVWQTRCGRYRVSASEECFGVKLRPIVFTAWVAVRVKDIDRSFDSELRISRHRSRAAAMAACETHSRRATTRSERASRND